MTNILGMKMSYLIGRVKTNRKYRKRIKYHDISTVEGNYNAMHYKSAY